MRIRLLDFLCCPDCRHEELGATVYRSDGSGENQKIIEGEILCHGCSSRFPVINGVPRLLPISLRRYLVSSHPDFFKRYPELIPPDQNGPPNEKIVRTLEGYSYQHLKLNDQRKEIERWKNTFLSSIPVGPDFFKGKFGVDVGCGMGRHLYWAHKFGAEMVGIDLSGSVELARSNTEESARCHIVQGDIYHLPFKRGVFDFAYSIGVLHFLPDPCDGFQRIVPSVKPGGKIFIWVYGLSGMRLSYRFSHMTWLRGMGPRLPRWGQYLVSMVVVFLLELVLWIPCRVVSALRGGDSIVARVPLGDSCRRSFTAKIEKVFNRLQPPVVHYHSAGEIENWFKESGFGKVSVINRDGRGWIATNTLQERRLAALSESSRSAVS